MFSHKNIRLHPSNYLGQKSHFITILTNARHPVFADISITTEFITLLQSESSNHSFFLHAYCFMPDHLHFLVEGLEPTSDLLRFVKSFKLKSSGSYLQQTSKILWQKKFYDNIIRSSQPLEPVILYILMNPVRKHLASALNEYPFSYASPRFKLSTRTSTDWRPPKP